MENAKKTAKKDWEKLCDQAEYDQRQRDQNHKMEIARNKVILSQGEIVIIIEKEKIPWLQMSL